MVKFYFLKRLFRISTEKKFIAGACMLFFMVSFLHPGQLMAQLDSEGWTILDPSKTSKVLYVSTSEGSDATAIVYDLPSGVIGSDPQHPAQAVKAFKTIAAAESHVKNGDAAWILLKTSDTFYETINPASGKSATEPVLYSYYGNGTKPPLLKTGNKRGITKCCKGLRNFQAIGLSFYAHTRNPQDPEYVSSEGNIGIRLFAGAGSSVQNILIEGCVFRFYTNNVINGDGNLSDITFRRNIFADNYKDGGGHSQGMYTAGVNNFVLVENIFDHNGWYKQSVNSDNDQSDGQATIFNHDTYFANAKNTTFTGNSFFRPSSIGTKWTANNGEASSANLTITNNLYYDFEVGISIGGNEGVPPYRFKNINVSGNVFSAAGLSRQTNRRLGWHIDVNDWDQGVLSNNLLIHQNSDEITNGWGILVEGETRDVQVNHNILYNLKHAHGIMVEKASLENVDIDNNELSLNLTGRDYYVRMDQMKTSLFENNTYHSLGNEDPKFRIGTNTMDLATWKSTVNEPGANTTDPGYPAPERSVEMYVTQVLGLYGMEEFYSEIRKVSRLNWKKEYTAPVINEWIKEGFGVGTAELFALTVTNGTGSGNYQEGSVVEISAADAPEGQVFGAWTGDVEGVADVNSPNTTLSMPAGNISLTATFKAAPAESKVADIPKTGSAPAIDGKTDGLWQHVAAHSIGNFNSGTADNEADLSGTFKMMWDEQNLYVLVDVKDQTLVPLPSGEKKWNFDGIEIFIDGDYSRGTSFDGANDFQFTYNQGVEILFSNPDGHLAGMETAEVLTEGGYQAEFKMPWATLNTTPGAENLIGLEVALNDNDGSSNEREGYKSWNRTEPAFWGKTESFGTGRLTEVLHALAVTAENGTVSVDPQQESYVFGQQVTLTANPGDGFDFTSWSGDAAGNASVITMVMDAGKSVTADFSEYVEGEANIVKTSSAPVIDGSAESLWHNVNSRTIGNVVSDPGTVDNEADLSGTFKMLWDEQNLYVLVDVKDQTLVPLPSGEKKWNFDGIEIFIDGDYSRGTSFDGANDFQFTYTQGVEILFSNPDGHLAGTEVSETITEGGYMAEIKLPWSTLNTSPKAGSRIGLEVALNDNDGAGTTREGNMSWKRAESAFWGRTDLYGTGNITAASGAVASDNLMSDQIQKYKLKGIKDAAVIYPNPSTGKITVVGEGTIIIRNSLGKLIGLGKSSGKKEFDLSREPAGLYIIEITNGDKTVTGKLMIE